MLGRLRILHTVRRPSELNGHFECNCQQDRMGGRYKSNFCACYGSGVYSERVYRASSCERRSHRFGRNYRQSQSLGVVRGWKHNVSVTICLHIAVSFTHKSCQNFNSRRRPARCGPSHSGGEFSWCVKELNRSRKAKSLILASDHVHNWVNSFTKFKYIFVFLHRIFH